MEVLYDGINFGLWVIGFVFILVIIACVVLFRLAEKKRSLPVLEALVEEDKKRIENTVKSVVDKFDAIETILDKK